MNKVTIRLNGKAVEVKKGVSLVELSKEEQKGYKSRIVAAKVNNELKELTHTIEEESEISFVDLTDDDGVRIYQRSLKFILIKAVKDLFPDREAAICHSISRGIFFEILRDGKQQLISEEVKAIEAKMWELIKQDVPFNKLVVPLEDAKQLLMEKGRYDRYLAIKYRTKSYVSMYTLDDIENYFYGYMVPSTGYIDKFKLEYYENGLIMILPNKENPTSLPDIKVPEKLFGIFTEYRNWGKILGVENVGDLNEIIMNDNIGDLIRISEALHEKKIGQIADKICFSTIPKRIILIAGPSSSGKTTFAHRLSIQLRVNGYVPIMVSLDDYFLNRENTPVDEFGEKDFEALEAVDVKLFNQHLNALLKGEEIEKPIYNFKMGKREEKGEKLRLEEGNILVIEGIHGLNPKLTSEVEDNSKFKIYVSAITSMKIDNHNRIPTTDSRKIRRITRDFQFRGVSAISTIDRWPSVRRGEEKNIFPYQEQADIMFNSSLIYELGVLRSLAEPVLKEITPEQSQYAEARRLIEFLSYFLPIETKDIPDNSIVKEFLGGSCFYR